MSGGIFTASHIFHETRETSEKNHYWRYTDSSRVSPKMVTAEIEVHKRRNETELIEIDDNFGDSRGLNQVFLQSQTRRRNWLMTSFPSPWRTAGTSIALMLYSCISNFMDVSSLRIDGTMMNPPFTFLRSPEKREESFLQGMFRLPSHE
jgi:hypothetical protein